MWYFQVQADDGEWCDYPGIEATSADECMRLANVFVERHGLKNMWRIHPFSTRVIDAFPVSKEDAEAIRKRASNWLGFEPSPNPYIMVNDVMQKVETLADWESKYREEHRKCVKMQKDIDTAVETLTGFIQ